MAQRTLLLIVDPHTESRDIYRTFLETQGWNVIDAEGADEGLRLARRHSPDLIITEYPLAVQGGATIVHALKADPATAGIRIFVLTADVRPTNMDAARADGADVCHEKPMLPSRVAGVVRRLLGEGPVHAEH